MATVTAAAPVTTGRPRAVYTRVAALGLFLLALAPATMLTASFLAGMALGGEVVFFGVTIVVPLLAAGLVWRFGLWAKIVGIVVGLAVAFMMFWMAFGLAYPASVADFVPGVLLPLGAVLAIGGGVAAIVQHRRGRLEVGATDAERKLTTAALAVPLLALVISGGLMLTGRSAADVPGALSTTIKDFAFAEEVYTLPAGQATTIVVRNNDPFVHTFTVPALGVDEVVLPGSDAVVELTAPAGTYTLYCKPHADMNETDPAAAGMAATIEAR